MSGTDFCVSCRKFTEHAFEKRKIEKTIAGIPHEFDITVAVCSECGEEMSPSGLIDQNIQEFLKQTSIPSSYCKHRD